MLEVLRYIAYIALNACVKYCTKDQSNVKDGVEGTLFGFQSIKCYVMLCMSKMSKMVFAAFTEHCIQSNVTHARGVKGVKYFTEQKIKKAMYCTLYTEASHPSKGEGYLKSLPSSGFSSSSPVRPRRQLC